MTDDQVTALLEDAGRLARIEAKLERIEAKLAAFEQAASGFLAGPGLARLFKAIAGKNGQ
jgi:hypothetical protein